MGNVFEIEKLNFSYGDNHVIRDLSVNISEGKITTLIGANGCGKSTLFNLMTKNLRIAGGSIKLGGEDIHTIKLRDFAKRVAIVHQYNTAPDDISVEKLVGYGRTPHRGFGLPGNSEEDGQIIAQGEPEQVISEQLIKDVYGVALRLTEVDGKPFVLPV